VTPTASEDAAPETLRARRSASPDLPFPPEYYDRPAEQVARDLLGARLVSELGGVRCMCEIVETEAYVGPHDDASHAHVRLGVTPRNRAMFGPPGRAYVYRIYGIHWCLNAVTGPPGFPAAVLVRAARPLQGEDGMAARRPGRAERDWLRGPGKLTQALGIDGDRNGHPLDQPPLRIIPGRSVADAELRVGPRIGITRAADWPLRFWIGGSHWVSRHA
jgi:DNA-3-methyladenine glycosylase